MNKQLTMVFLEVDPEDTERVQARYPSATIISDVLEGEALVEACRDAAVVSVFIYTKFTPEVIAQLPQLKLLCTRSVGYNHIDLEACAARGITVCNVPDYGSHVIAEHVFALLLSTIRHIPEADKSVEAGEFDFRGLRGMSLRGKTMGIVGTGKIGRRTAQIARGFGMNVVATDRCRVLELEDMLNVQYVPFDELLERSDVISMHVPATDETHHLFNGAAFAKMKDGVVIVNTARGEIIDSHALLEALNSGKVAYALLDVLENETVFAENKALIEHPNAVVTPHIAFYAEESMRNMYEDCFESIDQYVAGNEPDHVVHEWKEICDLPGVQNS